jgi:hypothetical protein
MTRTTIAAVTSLVALATFATIKMAAQSNASPTKGQDAISNSQLIQHQGKLTDLGGTPITGTRTMVFRLYTGTEQLWTESRSVSFDRGVFSVLLGSVNPIPAIPESSPCSLETIVEGAPALPKIQI